MRSAKVTLVDHPDNLSAVIVSIKSKLVNGKRETCDDTVVHVPYADGMAPVIARDTDDHAIIGSGLCRSLNPMNAYPVNVSCELPAPTTSAAMPDCQ